MKPHEEWVIHGPAEELDDLGSCTAKEARAER
jgi:hypothetical protein